MDLYSYKNIWIGGCIMDEKDLPFEEVYGLDSNEYNDVYIEYDMFSIRVINRLLGNQIDKVGKLLRCSHNRLASIKGFGTGCFREIYDYLNALKKNVSATDREGLSNSQKQEIPIYYKENVNSILKNDFSFSINPEAEREIILKYDEANKLVEKKLLGMCISNPQYTSVLNQSLRLFGKALDLKIEILSQIPDKRKGKKVVNYINILAEGESKYFLKNLLESDNETIEQFIYKNYLEFLNSNIHKSKFIKACTFDLMIATNQIFDEFSKNERTYLILQKRSDGVTLEEVGNLFLVTRERIRQIERKAGIKLTNWIKANKILLKMIADENGNNVFSKSKFEIYFGEKASIMWYLLKTYVDEINYLLFDKELELLIYGDVSIVQNIRAYIEEFPSQFNEIQLNGYLQIGLKVYGYPIDIQMRVIEGVYKKTGDVYHSTRLTLGTIYEDILLKYYPNGVHIYDVNELNNFRNYIRLEYGDINVNPSDRSIVARVASIGVLCDRGTYCTKKERYISEELKDDIYNYIKDGNQIIYSLNTIYDVFREHLENEGVNNKYYLQGILKELFSNDFVLTKDYISKDPNITTVYSEIISLIENSKYPISKSQICEAFPGITEVVLNMAFSNPDVINLFGEYVHSKNLKLMETDIEYLDNVMQCMFDNNNFVHCKEIYGYISKDNPNLLKSNGIYQAFGLYSLLEYLYSNKFEFMRPYIGRLGVQITKVHTQLQEMVEENEKINLKEIINFAKKNHFHLNSILDFAVSCNDTHLLLNNQELASLNYIGVDNHIAHKVEYIILNEIKGTTYVSDIQCINEFPKINVKWTEWLIYTLLYKWGENIEVAVTSTIFRYAKAVVAPKGILNMETIEKRTVNSKDNMYLPDNLENIDELIFDISFDDL